MEKTTFALSICVCLCLLLRVALRMRSTDVFRSEYESEIKPPKRERIHQTTKQIRACSFLQVLLVRVWVNECACADSGHSIFRGSKLHARIHFCHCKHENEPNKRKESCMGRGSAPSFLYLLLLVEWVYVRCALVFRLCVFVCVIFFRFVVRSESVLFGLVGYELLERDPETTTSKKV